MRGLRNKMNNDNNITISSGGIFIALLQVAFIVLKLCHVIDWSWWLVLIPIWIDIILAVIVITIVTIGIIRDIRNG